MDTETPAAPAERIDTAEDAGAVDVAIAPAPPTLPGLDSPLSATNGGPGLVYARLLALKTAVTPLDKDRRMEIQGTLRYKFRGIDDMYNHLHQLLGEFGLLLVPGECLTVEQSVYEAPPRFADGVGTRSNHVRVIQRYRWMAADGSTMVVELPGEGMDNGDKATGKALSMAHKYALIQSLGLPTGDPDSDDFATEGTPAMRPAAGPDRSPAQAPAPAGETFDVAAAAAAIAEAADAEALGPIRSRVVAAAGQRLLPGEEANRLMRLIQERKAAVSAPEGFAT